MTTAFKKRSTQKEWMELPDAPRSEVDATLEYIHFTNRVLGGNQVLFSGLNRLMSKDPQRTVWRVLDLGCGDGRMLKEMANWAKTMNFDVEWTGLDIDRTAIQKAQSDDDLSFARFICADAADYSLDYSEFDIVTGTLFFHHLTTPQILALFKRWNDAGVQVLVNDLQRSRLAWLLFRLFAVITAAPKMARHDGALSVQRGFTNHELEALARESGFSQFSVRWKWAFRYQLILQHD